MTMTKTLGGDRLGAGKKMKVHLHGYERSTHDMSYLWRSTMSSGTLVPFLTEVALPGDTFDIRLNCDIKTHPTVGPLFGSYKVQLDIFQCPVRLYQGQLHNNKLGVGMNMAAVKLPIMELAATVFNPEDVPDVDNSQINPSCILSYLGIRGVGLNVPAHAAVKRRFNAIPLLAYWDIYKQYYANKQEELGAVIHTTPQSVIQMVNFMWVYPSIALPNTQVLQKGNPDVAAAIGQSGYIVIEYNVIPQILSTVFVNTADGRKISLEDLRQGAVVLDPGLQQQIIQFDWATYGDLVINNWEYLQDWDIRQEPPEVLMFNLNHIDDMREQILATAISGNPFSLNSGVPATLDPYKRVLGATGSINHMLGNQEGLGLKTYQSDLFNNWLRTEWIDGPGGINDITAISTAGGSFNVDTLILARKVYDMLNRIAISGGSYDDWMDSVYTHERDWKAESPMYMGGLIKELVFQEVVSNSQSATGDGGGQPLGTLAGKGVMANKHKGGNVRIRVDEISYLIGIISLTPRIDYSQGNKWDVHLETMDDFHKPALDGIGFQELITEQMAWWSTRRAVGGSTAWVTTSAGKQPAWINYMTNVNQTRGNFAIDGNEMFMTLNRRYEADPLTGEIVDLTTYIDPKKFNNIFADTARDAQNFWAQISIDMEARRKLSAKIIPNL